MREAHSDKMCQRANGCKNCLCADKREREREREREEQTDRQTQKETDRQTEFNVLGSVLNFKRYRLHSVCVSVSVCVYVYVCVCGVYSVGGEKSKHACLVKHRS